MRAKPIMIQGTMSNAGKSVLVAALCRIFKQDGYKVAPFKSQNMALNSFITNEGLEMGRAQVVQAEAAGIEPSVRMNPILMKPSTDTGAQIILNGEVFRDMSAMEYSSRKRELIRHIMSAYTSLADEYDIIVLEGAGSPAEINLRSTDVVNMGMAKLVNAPVLLAGDIDLGGVFAQLYGTVKLLEPDEQDMIKGLIINKFRGDLNLLMSGLPMIEELTGKPVVGTVPMLDIDIEDEDSVSVRLQRRKADTVLDIVVIGLPHISNFTDFTALEATPGVDVRYVRNPRHIGNPDMLILPGSKNTMFDLKELRVSGIEAIIKKLASRGTVIFGICGGYQMLGRVIRDPEESEGGGEITGMGLLQVETDFAVEKHRSRTRANALPIKGVLFPLSGTPIEGYEIHMGETRLDEGVPPLLKLENGNSDGCQQGNIYGTYLHGFFDTQECRNAVLSALAENKGVSLEIDAFDMKAYKEAQFDKLADGVRNALDMKLVYEILEKGITS